MANQTEGQHRLVALTTMRTVPDEPNDPVMEIVNGHDSVGFVGAFVVVTVRYGGGSAEHDFHAYWDGSSSRSDPPRITVHLRHNANGDPGKAILEETLQIDVMEPYREHGELVVVVATAETSSEPVSVKGHQ